MLVVVAVALGNVAISGRNRSRPSLFGPRNTDSETRTSRGELPTPFRSALSGRDHETTVRPNAAILNQQSSQISPSQVKFVEAQPTEQVVELAKTAIQKTQRRYLDVDEYTPWQIMHGLLALRQNYQLKSRGQLISAVDYISGGPTFRGEYWFERTAYGGRAHPFSVPYHFEGHVNQFPALMATTALPADHKIKVQGGTITVADIVRNAQMTVNTNEEISWTLWFLTQYISQDAEWVNQQGQPWSMAELVRLQVQAPVYTAPCGGTHGLYALAFSRNAYLKQHGRLRGVWMQSEYKLRQHIELARQLQNPDGSFSTNWFRGRGFTYDFKERIKTSGHMLEWLMMALPSNRLKEPWVARAVQCVANDLIQNANAPAECGPMYHAVHALVLYHERMAAPSDSLFQQQQIAKQETRPQPNRQPAPVATPTAKAASAEPLVTSKPVETTPAGESAAPVASADKPAPPAEMPAKEAAVASDEATRKKMLDAPETPKVEAAPPPPAEIISNGKPQKVEAPAADMPLILAQPQAQPQTEEPAKAAPMTDAKAAEQPSTETKRPLLVLERPLIDEKSPKEIPADLPEDAGKPEAGSRVTWTARPRKSLLPGKLNEEDRPLQPTLALDDSDESESKQDANSKTSEDKPAPAGDDSKKPVKTAEKIEPTAVR